uniref:Uncharacterized protein n=1 Tax=Populus trichocarpa TaxID=3694 RepID=B9IET5_POPTR
MASTGPEHELREDEEVFVFVGFVEFEVKKMVENNFNLWHKNVFFYAAEEVRESFDVRMRNLPIIDPDLSPYSPG